jgi:hypothetical protein
MMVSAHNPSTQASLTSEGTERCRSRSDKLTVVFLPLPEVC